MPTSTDARLRQPAFAKHSASQRSWFLSAKTEKDCRRAGRERTSCRRNRPRRIGRPRTRRPRLGRSPRRPLEIPRGAAHRRNSKPSGGRRFDPTNCRRPPAVAYRSRYSSVSLPTAAAIPGDWFSYQAPRKFPWSPAACRQKRRPNIFGRVRETFHLLRRL